MVGRSGGPVPSMLRLGRSRFFSRASDRQDLAVLAMGCNLTPKEASDLTDVRWHEQRKTWSALGFGLIQRGKSGWTLNPNHNEQWFLPRPSCLGVLAGAL